MVCACERGAASTVLLLRGSRPFPIDELATKDLARRIPWNGVDELDLADLLVRRDALGDERRNFVQVDVRVARDDERLRHFARFDVRLRDDSCVADTGMFHQNRLELGGRDLIALVL